MLKFGDKSPSSGTPYERATRLVDLIRKKRTLLILDGIEVLQYDPDARHNCDIYDRGFRDFLNHLTEVAFSGFVLLTTRYLPGNFGHREPTVVSEELARLDSQTARAIIVTLGVQELLDPDGSDAIDKLIEENEGHALALIMLAR